MTLPIPSAPPAGRNLVICCDGTNNEVVGNQSNVLRLFRMLERSERQLTYYDAGVGTMADWTAHWRLVRLIHKRLDGGIGLSIRDHVLDAYRFLIQEYREGDAIWLFGFSRGAYSARVLAAMLKLCGLLRPEHAHLAEYAWAVATDEDRSGKASAQFGGSARINKVFGRDVRVHFVGVWDTVSAFGWIWDLLSIPHTTRNDLIDHLRHAVSLDERRIAFRPGLSVRDPETQDVKEVWFAGAHSDVGGGYPDKESGLARITLRWMLAEAKPLGLRVNPEEEREQLKDMGVKDQPDALGPAHDEATKVFWRILTWLPRRAWSQQQQRRRWSWPNWARLRRLPRGLLVHPSVRDRLADAALKYRRKLPKDARWDE